MRIRRQEGYLLQKIGKTVYLLPYGQKIADQKRGMELNETALRLWEMLEQPQTVEALTDKMAAYYEIPKEEQGELAKDIEAFVQELLVFGAVRRELGCPKGSCEGRLHIAGIKIEVYGEKGCIPKQFDAFRMTDGGNPEKAIPDLILELAERLPGSRQNGTILIRNRDLTVAIWEEGYVFRSVGDGKINPHGTLEKIVCDTVSERGSEPDRKRGREIRCLWHPVVRNIKNLYGGEKRAGWNCTVRKGAIGRTGFSDRRTENPPRDAAHDFPTLDRRADGKKFKIRRSGCKGKAGLLSAMHKE